MFQSKNLVSEVLVMFESNLNLIDGECMFKDINEYIYDTYKLIIARTDAFL